MIEKKMKKVNNSKKKIEEKQKVRRTRKVTKHVYS